jgi:hypothetical protein
MRYPDEFDNRTEAEKVIDFLAQNYSVFAITHALVEYNVPTKWKGKAMAHVAEILQWFCEHEEELLEKASGEHGK